MKPVMLALCLLITLACLACAEPSQTIKGDGLEPFAKAGATARALKGKRYALIIGIDTFADPQFHALKYTTQDARALGAALKDFDHVTILTSAERTTRASILEHLAKIKSDASSPQDTVLVYFSTHGTLAQAPGMALERYLVVQDTRQRVVRQTGLSVEEINRWMAGLRATKRALILATCHSGQGKSILSDELTQAIASHKSSPPPLEERSEASVILAAAGLREVAREDERLGHDIYTYFLLQALTHGDLDQDGATTISEAHDYARERTYLYTKGAQRPWSLSAILGRDPIILSGQVKRRPKPVIYSYKRSAQDIEVQLNQQSKGTLPGGIVVEPGTHELTLIDGQTKRRLYRGQITIAQGQRLELLELIKPPPKLWIGSKVGARGFLLEQDRALLPLGPALGICVGAQGGPTSWSFASVCGHYSSGQSQELAFGQRLPFTWSSWGVQVELGAALSIIDTLQWRPALGLGWSSSSRRFELPRYKAYEQLNAPDLSLNNTLSWSILPWLALELDAQLGLRHATLRPQRTALRPIGALELGLLWRWSL